MATKYLSHLVRANYGNKIKTNIHTDSIFMGASGGAMFARRNIQAELPSTKKKTKTLCTGSAEV
ncbi:MAG: hypothetical protein IT223_07715 [Crocinitomicaceae bacterium]|nr:hypothetical protein [Crocinitomicaceae bacterium]